LFSASVLLLIFATFISCEKFEGTQTMPSYIRVDTFKLVNNSQLELGFLSHSITDVWVYVDDQIIGAFELPALRIPVLLEGKHKLTLVPGIKYNGISGTRGPYYFLEPDIDTGFVFYIDSIIKVNPVVKYYNSTYAAWLEDFDDASNSLQPSPDSDTSLQFLTYEPADTIMFGNASGIGYVDAKHPILEVASYNEEVPGIKLPKTSPPIFLEMQYNTDIPIVVGLFIIETGVQITRHPILVINPSGGVWKKIYVNMTPTVSDNYNADYFNVFIRAEKPAGLDLGTIKIDNLKLLTNQKP
jgi:hypothetical protein